jgi:hypothetical protein
MTRKKIGLENDINDLILEMSEGNPSGLRVIMELMQNPVGFMYLLSLDDMNIRGSQIWVGYNDFCKGNIDTFIDKIRNRDQKMVDYINSRAMDCDTTEVVVTSGASYKR